MSNINLIPEGIMSNETTIFNDLLDRFDNIDLTTMLVYIIDLVNSSALPHLAQQFSITDKEGWDLAVTDTDKRNLIKNAIPLHKLKGKKKGILYVLEVLGIQGDLQLWNEYNGDPYHFKVSVISSSNTFDNTVQQKLIDLINEFKRENSVLDGLELILSSSSSIYAASYINMGEELRINC